MAWKQVDGSVMKYMMEAVDIAAQLNIAMADLRNHVCHTKDDKPEPEWVKASYTRNARTLCRKLSDRLTMVQHCLDEPDEIAAPK